MRLTKAIELFQSVWWRAEETFDVSRLGRRSCHFQKGTEDSFKINQRITAERYHGCISQN